MKTLVVLIIAVSITSLASGQNKFDDFKLKKKSIELNTGICMSYVDAGNPKGDAVLLLHGYSDTSRSFQFVTDELTRLNPGMRIVVPDLRGHGDTTMPLADPCKGTPEKCFTPEKMGEDVMNLMDQLCIQKIYVVGHSMGSIVAQGLALNYPNRIISMVLIGAFVNGKECDTIQKFLIADLIETNWRCILEERPNVSWPADVYSLIPMNMGEKVKTYLKENWVTEAAAAQDFLDAVFPETIKIPLGTWIGAIKALGNMDYTTALQKLKTPTLILWATQDAVTTLADQEKLKAAFQSAAKSNGARVFYKTYGKLPLPAPGYQLTELGHNLHWAVPRAVAEDIHSFFTTGTVSNNLVYANPENTKEILVEEVNCIEELK